jgi:hypothetical protein
MTTKEEVEKSPIFKIIKKGLMVKYPWIKNVYVENDEDVRRYNSMLFLDADIDAPMLARLTNTTLASFVLPSGIRRYLNKDHFDSVYLTTMFTPEDSEVISDIQKQVDRDIRKIQSSEAIPQEFRYNQKTFGVSNYKWIYPPQEVTPPTVTT